MYVVVLVQMKTWEKVVIISKTNETKHVDSIIPRALGIERSQKHSRKKEANVKRP